MLTGVTAWHLLTATKIIMVVLLALAQPMWGHTSESITVVFAVDKSESLSNDAKQAADNFVSQGLGDDHPEVLDMGGHDDDIRIRKKIFLRLPRHFTEEIHMSLQPEVDNFRLKRICVTRFPAARDANLIKSTVIKEVHATYSPRPGIDAYRSATQTAWRRVFLAGSACQPPTGGGVRNWRTTSASTSG